MTSECFNLATHNGKLTVLSIATGEHRTFRIKTQKPGSTFAPGQRVISLLTGSDNQSSYTGFGFVRDNGKISVYTKKLGTWFEDVAKFLGNLAKFEAAGKVEVNWSVKCRKCNKELTTPESIRSGIGPVCAGLSI